MYTEPSTLGDWPKAAPNTHQFAKSCKIEGELKKLTYWPSTRRDCEGVAAKGEDACNSFRCTMIPGFNVVMAGFQNVSSKL